MIEKQVCCPLLGIVGYSGTGKTTLLKKIIACLCDKKVNVGLIKHTHHHVDFDLPGKDSYQLRKVGAIQTMIVNDKRWALMTETPRHPESLYSLAKQFSAVDLILVEGFKHEPIPKLVLYRAALQKPLMLDKYVLAIVSDTDTLINTELPILDINDAQHVTHFILEYFKEINNKRGS